MAILGGRRTAPLSEEEAVRVSDTFLALDPEVRTVRHDPDSQTCFRVVSAEASDTNEEFGEIVFGPDIYPGKGIANPNSAMDMRAAAAHELAHYHRWKNTTELPYGESKHLDEALTSLEAVARYGNQLSQTEIGQLVGDSMYRIGLHVQTESHEVVDAGG